MLQRVTIEGVELPQLYIAENQADALQAMDAGIPFVRWTSGKDELVRTLLRPALEKMFPHIKWDLVLGRKAKYKTKVIIHHEPEGVYNDADNIVSEGKDTGIACIPDGTRYHIGGKEEYTEKLSIEEYMGDTSSYVNIEVLQQLRLMPQFIGNILDCIKVNSVAPIYWREGYNKKRQCCLGNYNVSGQLRNLIILDVSGSIPRGISATMIALIDTLRTQVSADLIITSSHSKFFAFGDTLPDPQHIRDLFGYANESEYFFDIMKNRIAGKHYGHVFSFGDDDTPYYPDLDKSVLSTIKVEKVHHYHTGYQSRKNDGTYKTGYGKWCHMLGNEPEIEYDTSWCEVIAK